MERIERFLQCKLVQRRSFARLELVIENVTGESFSEALKARVLQPLGMQSSSFDIDLIPSDQRVSGFDKQGKQQAHPWDLAFLPSSGLQTNARDLARFAQAVLRINEGIDREEILRFESLQEMTVVRIATEWNGIDQGYAWQIINSEPGPVWRHAGGEAGLESLFAVYPESEIGIAVLGNQQDWPRFQLVGSIRSTFADTGVAPCTP